MRWIHVICLTAAILAVSAKPNKDLDELNEIKRLMKELAHEADMDKREDDKADISNAVVGSKGVDIEETVGDVSADEAVKDKRALNKDFNKKPNFIFLLADDLGWHDVSWHNDEVHAPNMKALVEDGIEMDSHYVQNVCSPSRHALMTGVYPFRAGMGHGVIMENAPECSPLSLEFMPQALQQLGYATHMVGKWHLGMCDWKCTPTYRGFDTFYGFYQGFIDHYTHMYGTGYDWRDQEEVVRSNAGTYATDLLTERALDILDEKDPDDPFFMYFSFNNVHIPLSVPQQFYDLYKDRSDISEDRKIYLGMVSSMDDAIGQLVQKLKDTGLYDNTILVFSADNGGEAPAGNNAPLRGAKGSLYEGAMRAASFVHSPLFSKTAGQKATGLVHETDWLPTFVSLAGGTPKEGLDGVDQSDLLINGGKSARDMIVHKIDEVFPQMLGYAAIRKGDWKLISGSPGLSDGRDGDYENPWKLEEFAEFTSRRKRHYEMTAEEKQEMADFITNIQGHVMLFNIAEDPNEYNNVASANPEVVQELLGLLSEAHETYVGPEPENMIPVEASDPKYYDGVWTPGWCTK